MKTMVLFLILFASVAMADQTATTTTAKQKPEAKVVKKYRYKKTQELSFDSESVDGVARNPYGAYLTQKRGIEFAPLYKVRDRFDENIKDSVNYMKVAK